jgi:uncharacterized protein (TIGR02246 family)
MSWNTVWMTSLMTAALLGPVRGGMVGTPSVALDPGVRAVADAYRAAMLAGDASAAASLYRDDGVDMPPGKPPIEGRTAIERYYRELFGACRFTTFDLNHTEMRASGDMAFATGTSRTTITPAGGPPVEDAGKYLVVLKRTDGRWKVAYSIYNSDHAPAH